MGQKEEAPEEVKGKLAGYNGLSFFYQQLAISNQQLAADLLSFAVFCSTFFSFLPI